MTALAVAPATAPLCGEFSPPGDKSLSHRAVILSALADGQSVIKNFLPSDDCIATMTIMQQLGVPLSLEAGILTVQGRGLDGLSSPQQPLNCQNAGTAARLLMGVLCAQPFSSTLVGDTSLSGRPQARVVNPLTLMGAKISLEQAGHLPAYISGQRLQGIDYTLPLPSAQVKSALLLAALFAQGTTRIMDPFGTRDHTERLLTYMGAAIQRHEQCIVMQKTNSLKPLHYQIPGDFSSAAFLLVAAAIVPGSQVTCRNVGLNPTRLGLLSVLRDMGANIQIQQHQQEPEPVGDITLQYAPLHSVTVPAEQAVRLIDEYPILSIAAAFAKGTTTFEGVQELRYKESDRLQAIAEGLSTVGIAVVQTENSLSITGGKMLGGCINSHNDHRIAMAFLVASLGAKAPITTDNVGAIAVSYPNFIHQLGEIGARIIGVSQDAEHYPHYHG